MLKIGDFGFERQETLYSSERGIVERGVWNGQRVVVKRTREANRLRAQSEYEILRKFDSPYIAKAIDLLPSPQGWCLLLMDEGGKTTDKQTAPMSWEGFLPCAIQLTQALQLVHEQELIHKDIKPANVLCKPSGDVQLLDFNVSSPNPREVQSYVAPMYLEGTLAYLAPEQTGRMNRSLDYRADFYSLGVTFYTWLTGNPPFASSDPLELIHCHLAVLPEPIAHLSDNANKMLSKLMAKNAEDRYQSATGLVHDLQRFQHCVENNEDDSFPLAAQDISSRFTLPTKLYGREDESEQMREVFATLSKEQGKLVLVGGYSGIGKTALIHEVHRPLVAKRGYYAHGKFDQFKRDIPYSALSEALTSLLIQLMSEGEVRRAVWKQKALDALQNEGQVLIDLVPMLESLLGKQPPVGQLEPKENQVRVLYLLKDLLCALANKEHTIGVVLG
jgi:serine/threonine protein kinase